MLPLLKMATFSEASFMAFSNSPSIPVVHITAGVFVSMQYFKTPPTAEK